MPEPAATPPILASREETETAGYVLYKRQVEAIDRLSEETNRSKSDVVRELLDRALGEAA